VTGSLTQNVQKGANIETVVFSGVASEPARSWNLYFLQMNFDKTKGTYTISGTVPEYFQDGSTSDKLTIDGKEYTLTLNVGSASVKSSSSVAGVRSSSSAKSSSSAQVIVPSSSSAKSSSSVSGGTSTELKYVSGGASGSGWATRYWDCCKPSCSWTENAGSGNEARMCTASGSKISNYNETSICAGGSASTCTSQIPIVVNDNLAYAFAAVPDSNGGACGKCFALTFDGTGKYETKAPHQSLKGKVLVVDDYGMFLHPEVIIYLTSVFTGGCKRASQLFVFDCNPTLLEDGLLRRDGIYFAEKDSVGSTIYYPLSDFKFGASAKTRAMYESGAFGALPITSEFRFVNEEA